MRILHCCLSCFYNEGYNYQENMLSRQNKEDGHEVLIVASTETFKDNKVYGYVEPQDYINKDGIRVIRVPYRKILNNQISRKFRSYKGVYAILEEFKPDVILFHGMSAWELLTVKKYIKKHNVKLYIDNHAARYNSGKNWFSLKILHGIFYKCILKRVLPVAEKLLCISSEEYNFAKDIYKVPEKMIELWPLGGEIQSDKVYNEKRDVCRRKLNVTENTIVFVHSGKMSKNKKTCELIRNFSMVQDDRFRLFIAGSFLEGVEEEAKVLIEKDDRVQYLGWKSGEELLNLLTAADIYLQPGTVSATMQNAMCCRCAVMIYPFEVYKHILQDKGIYVTNDEDILEAFKSISDNCAQVEIWKKETFERAKAILDYKKIAARIYH